MPETNAKQPDDIKVPWDEVVRFVRQLSHDLRNHLNAAELQSVFIGEIAADDELKAEIKRLREMLSTVGGALQKLSASLTPPKPNLIPYRAADLVEDIRSKFEIDFPDRKPRVQWHVDLGDGMLNVDPQLIQQALLELLENAFRHGSEGMVKIDGCVDKNEAVLTIREAKPQFNGSTDNWARQPLHQVGNGHYGLGLNRVRGILDAHGGTFSATYDSTAATLITTMALPLSAERS
jgi:K+-sensing histidine kinase KdpD